MAFTVLAPHEARLFVEVMAVGLAALVEIAVILLVTGDFGYLGDTPVGEGILQSASHGLFVGFQVVGDVPVLLQQPHRALVEHRARGHSLQGRLWVHIKALQYQVGQYGNTRVAHHAVGLVAHQVPHGQFALLFKDVQECLGDIPLLLAVDERLQGVGGAVSVPQRQRGVIGEITLMNLAVGTAVLAAHVTEHRRCHHRVEQGGIEHRFVILVARRDVDFAQLGVPSLVGRSHDIVEFPPGILAHQVADGVLDAYRRHAGLDKQRSAVVGSSDHTYRITIEFLQLHIL